MLFRSVLDPRGLTATGGLPYFGGPGASYNVHAIASIVERCRAGGFGLTVGLGGFAAAFALFGVVAYGALRTVGGLAAGVTILSGSDVGEFPHGDNAREIEMMVDYGMPAIDAVKSAD